MQGNLSIRSYSTKPTIHAHDFYQLVLPLRGVISIQVGLFDGKVAPGECVIVKEKEEHLFTAKPEARFVVADMITVPENISTYQDVVFAVKKPLTLYLNFIEAQLEQQVNTVLEEAIYNTFYHLLSEHILLPISTLAKFEKLLEFSSLIKDIFSLLISVSFSVFSSVPSPVPALTAAYPAACFPASPDIPLRRPCNSCFRNRDTLEGYPRIPLRRNYK